MSRLKSLPDFSFWLPSADWTIQTQATLKDQHQLLTTLVGVSDYTASVVLAEIGSITLFTSARQLAALSGLTLQEHQSGGLYL